MSSDKIQYVCVEKFSDLIEEEVTVSCGANLLTCFSNDLPRHVSLGSRYPVRLKLMVFNDYDVQEIQGDADVIERCGEGYGYKLVGRLSNGVLQAGGFIFEDDAFESEYAYLDGSTISITVDRIDLMFERLS
jgi:hypothetical protein